MMPNLGWISQTFYFSWISVIFKVQEKLYYIWDHKKHFPCWALHKTGKDDEVFWNSIWLRVYHIWFCTVLISVLAGLATLSTIIQQCRRRSSFISFSCFLFSPLVNCTGLLLSYPRRQVGHIHIHFRTTSLDHSYLLEKKKECDSFTLLERWICRM